MAGKLLPDALWDEIEGLFPVYQPSPDGGRPPKEARTVLTGCCSCSRRASLGKTCRKKRSSVRTRHVLGDLPSGRASASGSGCTSCSWQSCGRGTIELVTSAGRFEFGESPARRPKTGPNPTDRGRSGSKHCLLTDAGGIPLVVQLQSANQHDVNTCLPLVIEMPAVAGKPGRPKQKPTVWSPTKRSTANRYDNCCVGSASNP